MRYQEQCPRKPLALPWLVLAIQRCFCRAGHSSVPADGAPCQLTYWVLAPGPPACFPHPLCAVPAEAQPCKDVSRPGTVDRGGYRTVEEKKKKSDRHTELFLSKLGHLARCHLFESAF